MLKRFELTFRLPDPQADPASYLDALFEAGCDDALPGVGRKGYLAMTFSRQETRKGEAVRTAVADVLRAVPGAVLVTEAA